MQTPIGPLRIDLVELSIWAADRDVPMVLLEVVRNEVEATISAAIVDAFPHKPPRDQQRLLKAADRAWQDLQQRFQSVDAAVGDADILAARALFREHQVDLTAALGRPKDPVPGDNDLRILLKTARLGGRPKLISRDSHFLGYANIIAERWSVDVIDTRRLPLLLEEWRAK